MTHQGVRYCSMCGGASPAHVTQCTFCNASFNGWWGAKLLAAPPEHLVGSMLVRVGLRLAVVSGVVWMVLHPLHFLWVSLAAVMAVNLWFPLCCFACTTWVVMPAHDLWQARRRSAKRLQPTHLKSDGFTGVTHKNDANQWGLWRKLRVFFCGFEVSDMPQSQRSRRRVDDKNHPWRSSEFDQ